MTWQSTEGRGGWRKRGVVVGGGCRDWNITKERGEGGRGGEGEDEQTTWWWKACRLVCWERQTETSPHIDAAVSPQQQFWEMAAVCTVATIYMELIQPRLSLSSSVAGLTPWSTPNIDSPSPFLFIYLFFSQGFILHEWKQIITEQIIMMKNKDGKINTNECCRVEKGSGAEGWWRRERVQSGPGALETWVMASNLPGGSLVQSINGNSRKTAASLAHPGLGYALLEFDDLWQRRLCLAPAWTSFSSLFLTRQWKRECQWIVT